MAEAQKLPLFTTVRAAWTSLWAERRALLVLALVLTAVSVGNMRLPWPNTCGAILGRDLGTALVLDLPKLIANEAGSGRADALARLICQATVRLPPTVVTALLGVVFAVAWHRRVLLPADRQSLWTVYGWDWRKTKVALTALLLSIPTLALVLGAGLAFGAGVLPYPFGPVFDVLLPVMLALTCARFLLTFPALSADLGGELGRSWRWTRGNYWRLAAIVVLAPLPFLAVHHGIRAAALTFESEIAYVALSALATAFGYLGLAAAVTALSLSYRAIREAFYEMAVAGTREPGELRLGGGTA